MDQHEEAVRVYDKFIDHLNSKNFHYTEHKDHLVIELTVRGEDLPQPTYIEIIEQRGVLRIISPIPARFPEDKRVDAAVAVATANYGIVNGSFDLDMSDGEVRFRVAMRYRNMDIDDEMIHYLLAIVFMTTDKYNDRFFMLMKGMMTIEKFIELEEKE